MPLDRRTLLALAAFGRPARAADTLTIVLDWLPDANHAALFAAQHTGAFARAGLAVTLVAPSDPDTPVRLLAAGQADLAVGYGTQLNLVASAGLPVTRVATLIDAPLNTVMALDGIRTLADLRGKRLGYSVSGVEDALLAAMLASAGVGANEVTMTRVGYDMVPALLSGRLDAAIGAFRNAEVVQVRLLGRTPAVFLPERHGVPPYDELVLLARRDRVADPLLSRLLAALGQGTAALLRDPWSVWTAYAAAHPELATPAGRQSWAATLPSIPADPVRLDAARYLAFQEFALAHRIATRRLPLADFAVAG